MIRFLVLSGDYPFLFLGDILIVNISNEMVINALWKCLSCEETKTLIDSKWRSEIYGIFV